MITEEQYLDAKKIVKAYAKQLKQSLVSSSAEKKSSKEKEICPTCFNSRTVTIYENAGFAYKGKPYKIKCPVCR